MGRRGSSSRWLQRQSRDRYVKESKAQGYRSRAAFKLIELDRRDRLLRRGATVVDLGAAPGGWTQAAVGLVGPNGTVVAVDVLKMEAVTGAIVLHGDCRDATIRAQIRAAVGERPADLVMSDMAPNMTGIAATDEAAATELALIALDFARETLRPGGSLLVKMFRSGETDEVIKRIGAHFTQLHRRKPDASRAESREFYVVAKGFVI